MTDNQDKRKYILSGLDTYLKKRGFKKRAFTFRRETEAGLLQIIELSLGPSSSSAGGKVNLEFGIFADEWHKYLNRWKMPTTIRTPDCEIRDCYCTLVNRGTEHNWFELSGSPDDLILDMINVLDQSILPYLDRHQSRRDILESYGVHGEAMGLPPRHKLSIGILMLGTGNTGEALKLVGDEFSTNKSNPFYAAVYNNVIVDYPSEANN